MQRIAILLAVGLAVGGCKQRQKAAGSGAASVSDAAATGTTPDPTGGPGAVGALVTDAQLARFVAEHRSDDWYGVHIQGRKVGWANVTMRPSNAGEAGAYAVAFVAHIRLKSPDGDNESVFGSSSFYAGTPPFALVEHNSSEASDDGAAEHRFACGPDGITAIERIDGRSVQERRLPPTAETLASTVAEMALPPTTPVGHRMSYPSFDDDLGRDKQHVLTVERAGDELIAGVKVRVVTVAALAEGETEPTRTRIAGGRALEVTLGPGLRLELLDRAAAQSDVEGLSMMDTSVPVDRALGDPTKLTALTLVVATPPGFVFPTGPHQQVTRRPDGRHEVALRAVPGPAVTAPERAEGLAATAAFDADAPTILALARRLTDGARTDREKVDRIVDWVYANLAKDLSTDLSSASQVLARGRGDCTEHSLLVVALARAAGIAARDVSGLMYLDEAQRFFWHAWSQVELDGHWVAVDGAWGEHIADAAHLTFDVGETSNALATMGSLQIEAPPP